MGMVESIWESSLFNLGFGFQSERSMLSVLKYVYDFEGVFVLAWLLLFVF